MGFFTNLLPGRTAPAPNRHRGASGEDAAARYLESRGFRVLDRNWRFHQWELDLVCRDRDTVVFVEVKTRRAGAMAAPGEALTRKKQARLIKAASHYLTEHDLWDEPCRFDLASVTDTGASLDVELEENVFQLDGQRA
ncbi:YraN family protein [Desulfovibrio sp. Huiquan2017]|uniref:YraN family protein n=1 Tax=Desulfovibrio sp. Huiquan2017 TaxID=2816861 RepID=UPI00257074F5|nr:YraN family protein [Desulfovibrio sp. Huiquan2017]